MVPKKLVGDTMLDVVRANTFMAEVLGLGPREVSFPVVVLGLDPREVSFPVVGGHAGWTEVVQAKAGADSATLSMAYAIVKFADVSLRGLRGDAGIIELAFVSTPIPLLSFLSR
ncbi:hypothetical protein ACS0TY_034048 [Phlomoides rotata]